MFIIALGAIVVILGTGYWAFASQNQETIASISVGDGVELSACEAQGIEEFFLGFYLQSQADIINTPVSTDPSPVPYTVGIGENARSVSQKLVAQGFITDADVFRLFLRYNCLDSSLEAGDYQLRRNMNMREIAQSLQKANFEEVTITIPEGWRAEQVAEYLTQAGVMDGGLFLGVVRQGTAINHPLLTDRPVGASYEGYLFPDTYRLALNATPEDLITRMLDNMATKLPPNAIELANGQGRSLFEIMTVASIVEREAVVAEERPTIADVYLNRINQGMYLQADPTVQYAMGYQPANDQWWKTPVTLEEYAEVDSPYNTYLNGGLPPGPIANPGISSILATLEPDDTEYLFFMGCGDDGAHIFAVDFATHEQNVNRCSGG
ncbi:endolytic transglycosylase MltG [Anaerolineales bacterium HSG6]|nr:endolytic transglycosylase MltG [Anaerolineales bacterium HSG6]